MKKHTDLSWQMLGPRPAYRILSPLTGEVLEEGQMIAEVICDFCNREVAIRPVPVYHGHALCPRCFQEMFGAKVAEVAGGQYRIVVADLAPEAIILTPGRDEGQEQWRIVKALWEKQRRDGPVTRIPVVVRRPFGGQKHIVTARFHDELGFQCWEGQPQPLTGGEL